MTYFETERLILRGWREDDLPIFAAMNGDERVMRYFPATLHCRFTSCIAATLDAIPRLAENSV